MIQKLIVLVVCIVVSGSAGWVGAAEHTKETPKDVRAALAKGKAVLLDVRELDEWNEGHLADAKLLPLTTLQDGLKAEALKKLLPPGSVVYCHCRSGKRCLIAADLLKKQGYDVRALKPGYEDLLKAGFPKATK